MCQKRRTALQHIVPGLVKVVRVPRVSHFLPVPAAVVQKERYFAIRVTAVDALHIKYIRIIHPDQVVVILVVVAGGPAGALAAGIDAVLLELGAGRRIDRLRAGG